LPDVFAVNGSSAAAVIRRGMSPERVVLTEALRYGHLDAAAPISAAASSTLLVATGFRASEAAEQLRLIETLHRAGQLGRFARVWIKPHPMCPIGAILRRQPLTVEHTIVSQPLSSLLRNADVVFMANSTSATAEALCLGIPTAVCASGDEMNLSPAFGHPEVPMIANASELARFLENPSVARWPADYLVVDRGLPRWRRLLSA
jgi:surface carbohydrate biosynthesis protein (TIGR04326 family)